MKVFMMQISLFARRITWATSLRDDQSNRYFKSFNEQGKWIGAICAGPISLKKLMLFATRNSLVIQIWKRNSFRDLSGCISMLWSEYDYRTWTCRCFGICLYNLRKLGQPSKDIREGMQYHYLVVKRLLS